MDQGIGVLGIVVVPGVFQDVPGRFDGTLFVVASFRNFGDPTYVEIPSPLCQTALVHLKICLLVTSVVNN